LETAIGAAFLWRQKKLTEIRHHSPEAQRRVAAGFPLEAL